MDCSLPSSSVHGILQARILERVAISFSRGSFWPRNRTQVSCIAGRFFTDWSMREIQFNVYKITNKYNNIYILENYHHCNTSIIIIFFMCAVRTTKIYFLSNFQYNTVNYILYIRSPEIISLITGGMYILNNISSFSPDPTPVSGNCYFALYFCKFGCIRCHISVQVSSVTQSCLTLCNPMTAAHQASLSIINSQSLLKLISIETVMASNHLILCCPLLLLPSIFPSMGV